MTFSELHLVPELEATVAELGYDTPSPIQEGLIPVLLDGKDAIGQARTGTGKTAAFSLPVLQRLAAVETRGVVRALVLVPTRELCVQVSSAVYTYGKKLNMRALPIYGGQAYHKQTRRLEQGVDIVVATPGRLVDLLDRRLIDLSKVEVVVMDEADEMLSMGFADDLIAILKNVPDVRQTALLSATMPPAMRRIAEKYLTDPVMIAAGAGGGDKTAQDVEQRGYVVNGRDKLPALLRLLETEDVTSALCFVRTRVATSRLAADLQRAGYSAEPISGELSQAQRTEVLHRFKQKQVKILVATDVAARGLDIDHVSHVFNVNLPIDIESYVHRVGRTGRAGRSGVALSLVEPRESGLISRIQRYIKRDIPATPLPTADDVRALRAQRFEDELTSSLDGTTDADRAIVTRLIAEGGDPMEIAAGALAFARAQRPEAPLTHIHDRSGSRSPRTHSAPRQHFGDRGGNAGHGAPRGGHGGGHGTSHGGGHGGGESGMVRVAIDAGNYEGVRPNMVVSAIARTADIPGHALGKIMINEKSTFVDVPEQFVDQVLAQSGSFRFGKTLAQVELA